jgi:hypothetical protein
MEDGEETICQSLRVELDQWEDLDFTHELAGMQGGVLKLTILNAAISILKGEDRTPPSG